MTVGVILAGGRSQRMGGGDKCLLHLDERVILEHVIERLRSQVDDVVLNANGEAERFAGFGISVVRDSISGFVGPLGGVLAGLDWAAERGESHALTVAADTPFFPEDLLTRLAAARDEQVQPLSMAATLGEGGRLDRHPTFALWPVALRDDLRASLLDGMRKVIAWTDPVGCAIASFDDPESFFNVNAPDDLEHARRRVRRPMT